MLKLKPKDRLATVYGKPLVAGLGTSIAKALAKLKTNVIAKLRKELLQSPFSDRAKMAFAKALQVKTGPSSLTIFSTHPAFIHFMEGRRRRQMTWLVKAAAPIPIITETGELIFRSATAKSMADGKWVHPGIARYDFVTKVKKEATKAIKDAMVQEMKRIAKGKR